MTKTIRLQQKIIYTISLFLFCISHLVCASEKPEQEFYIQGKRIGSYGELGSMSQEEGRDSESTAEHINPNEALTVPIMPIAEQVKISSKKSNRKKRSSSHESSEPLIFAFEGGSGENESSSEESCASSTFSSESYSSENDSYSEAFSTSSTSSFEAESKSHRRTAKAILALRLVDLYEGSDETGWKLKEFPLEDLSVSERKSHRRTAEDVLALRLIDLYEGSDETGWKLKEFPLEHLLVQINQEETLPQVEASSTSGILNIQ